MSKENSALLVELLLDGVRIEGYCSQVELRRRLSEVLNTPGDVIELDDAVAKMTTGEPLKTPSITVEKKAIIAAIPWETTAQDRQRALATSMTGRAKTIQLPVVVISPPLVIAGTAHLPGGFGTSVLRADPNLFAHFFSMTGARITLEDGAFLDAPVVLVNRDAVSAMAQTAEPTKLRLVA
ncbi:MAG TPA: hypothetical protein VFS30_02190 [Dehalococcoidia bacterium]|nr:hypothetical protein [Dehalococcoidia bacterium]